ncbi:pyrroloquinoline quinone biosynthesis peptide chaperone PqqD [Teichococcus deserti]|uniref:pyrroloquinoline quinone biosynthesis peptide chaperone PqqD n=1 Tax=Teichococcus deserti TaxID=1817963 RepID=UPI001F61A8D1|nr:pyrroloquinoline quinone biosynthesis peptide chaperone PqqD [Pseudoroseomonas deserti]
MTPDSIPRFAPGVRFRFDKARDAWALLAPERLFQPDEQAAAILQLVDGARSIDAITDALAAQYDAPRDLIAGDVLAMLQDLADRGLLRS